MPSRLYWPFNGKQYFGNTNKKEVHDLLNEKGACNIDLIKPKHIKMFDTLEAAHDESFVNCDYCIGGSQH